MKDGIVVKRENAKIFDGAYGNLDNGIVVEPEGYGVNIYGNYIGFEQDGLTRAKIDYSGIVLDSTCGAVIGRTLDAEKNVISNYLDSGILVKDTDGSSVLNNYIGLNKNGAATEFRQFEGVTIFGRSSNNTIGGTLNGAQRGNLISNNTVGVAFRSDTIEIRPSQNLVIGNYIGTDATGQQRIGNDIGIRVDDGFSNTIGATSLQEERNVISGNQIGIKILADENLVAGNYIGLGVDGFSALGNEVGIEITGNNNTIGASDQIALRTVVSANSLRGIFLEGNANVVRNSYIGTDHSGTQIVGTQAYGIFIHGDDNMIGATSGRAGAADANVISGNTSAGIRLDKLMIGSDPFFLPMDNVIAGNIIGLTAGGVHKLGNANGVFINGGNANVIGVKVLVNDIRVPSNVISANEEAGIIIIGDGNQVSNCFIGTDISGGPGAEKLGNRKYGIVLGARGGADATNTIIGGINDTVGDTSDAVGNVISGNGDKLIGDAGVVIRSGSNMNYLYGNYIGLDATGINAYGNLGDGVYIEAGANNNTIGDPLNENPSARNYIAGNGFVADDGTRYGFGVSVWGNNNTIKYNNIGKNKAGVNKKNEAGWKEDIGTGNTITVEDNITA